MILYRFQSNIKFKGRSEKKILYILNEILSSYFLPTQKNNVYNNPKIFKRFCIRSLLLPFQEENNPKIMFNAINIEYTIAAKKNIQGKKPSIIIKIVLSLCALYSKSNPKLYSKKHFELSS